MKKALSMMLALTLVLMLAACGGGTTSGTSGAAGELPDEIIIGGLAPLTGDVAQYGIASNNGSMLAVKEINAAGGILGKQIKFVNYDEKGDPTEATTAYDKLVNQDNIVALVGDITTAPTMAVAQKAKADNLPMITPTGTGAAITEVGENIFRACFTDPYQGELMAHYAKEEMSATSAAVLFDTGDDYSKGVADAFEAAAKELGIEITTKEGYQSGATDFNAQLTKIKEGNPDVVMAPCYYGDASLILTQARDLGIESKFLGPDGWDGVLNQLDASKYDVANNSYYCSQYSLGEPGEKLQKFMDDYEAEYESDEYLNMFAVLGYEAMYLMAEAIKNAGSVDSDAIIAAMQSLDYDGISGKISFQGGNDPAREAYIIEFEDGKEKLLGTYSF